MAGVGIKSKERVKKFGEVYTPDSIVCDMLDGVLAELRKQEEYTNDKFIMETFLEPTCGDGQFLVRILDEKIKAVNEVPEKDRPLALVKAMTTIYGIDIQMDNVLESRERLKKYLFEDEVDTFTFKQDKDEKTGEIKTREFTKIDLEINPELEKCLSNIIDNNIIVGDMLKTDTTEITYYEWDKESVKIGLIALAELENSEEEQEKTELCEVNYLNIPNSFSEKEKIKSEDEKIIELAYKQMEEENRKKEAEEKALKKERKTKKKAEEVIKEDDRIKPGENF